MTLFPHLHSRSFQSTLSQGMIEMGGDDPQTEQKIKIIKELELKISQLESGVSKRVVGQDFIANIEK